MAAIFTLLEFFVVTLDIVGPMYIMRPKVLLVIEGFDSKAEVG